jgi:hypothetical protein
MNPLEWYDNGQFFLRRDGAASFLRRRRTAIDEVAGRSTWPVYGRRSNGCQSVVGTSFGLATKSARFVVTAAHVLNDAAGTMSIALPAAQAINGVVVKTSLDGSLHSNDSLDIGVIRLAPEAADVTDEEQFVRVHQTDVEPRLEDVGIRGDNPELMYALHGFPSSKNKVFSRSNRRPPQAIVDFAFPTFPAMYEAVGISPLTHLALKVGHNGAINEAGDEAVPPKLLGTSGGLVWRNDLSMPLSLQSRAVAMILEFNRRFRLIICVRLWVVFQLIRTCFPDLASEIPRLTTVAEPVLFDPEARS